MIPFTKNFAINLLGRNLIVSKYALKRGAASKFPNKDYYKILNIPKNAPNNMIKDSFRKLSKQYHPDVAGGDTDSSALFVEINEAFSILGKPELRKEYDLYRRTNAFNLNEKNYKMSYGPMPATLSNEQEKAFKVELRRQWNQTVNEWVKDKASYELERNIELKKIHSLKERLSGSKIILEDSNYTMFICFCFFFIVSSLFVRNMLMKTRNG